MTITSAVRRLSVLGAVWNSRTNYAADQIDDIIDAAAATETTYNPTVYAHADALTLGATQCVVGTVSHWFVGGIEDPNGVHPEAIQAKIDLYNANPTGTKLVIDIEEWSIRTNTAMALSQFTLAAGMWKEQTDREIGFYAYIPYHATKDVAALVKAAVDDGTEFTRQRAMAMLAREMHLNDYVNSYIGPLVDFYVPRCYVYVDGADVEHRYEASQQILEAIRLADGKPVYPIWWHSASDRVDGEYVALSEASFLASLKFVTSFPGIGGSVAWHGGTEPVYWAGHVGDLITQEGEFAPPVPP